MDALIISPLSNIFAPLQGSARLYAYVKASGFRVRFVDLNQNAFFNLLGPSMLGSCFDRISQYSHVLGRTRYLREQYGDLLLRSSAGRISDLLEKSRVNAESILRPYSGDTASIVYRVLEARETVIPTVARAADEMNRTFLRLSPRQFLEHYLTLLCGKALYDCAFFPCLLDFGFGFFGTQYGIDAGEITHAVEDRRHNYLIDYYESVISPLLHRERPRVVGVSITHSGEFVPGLTVCALVKRILPETHVCIGGAAVSEVGHRIRRNPLLWRYFDSFVTGPGEVSFCALLESIQSGKSISRVPNLSYCHRGDIQQSTVVHEFCLDEACCPEYPTHRSGGPLSLETSSGCYWGKCLFCYYPRTGHNDVTHRKSPVNERSMEKVVQDATTLKKMYEPCFISITDSSAHPARLTCLLHENNRRGLGLKFTAFLRLEREFQSGEVWRPLARKGLLGCQAGLESASQRVNNRIRKGITVSGAAKAIRNLSEAGVLVHLYAVVGTPGETLVEAEKTYRFIRRAHKYLQLGWQIYPFTLLEGTPAFLRASELGIEAHVAPRNILGLFASYKSRDGLSTARWTELAAEFHSRLERFAHPLCSIMDIETCKIYLLARKALDRPK